MEILLAFFAALGVMVMLISLALMLLSPVGGRNMVTVWHVSGTCEEMEFRVRLCIFLQKMGLFSPKLVLVDCGLTADARKRAELLCRQQPYVDLVFQKDLLTYFEM